MKFPRRRFFLRSLKASALGAILGLSLGAVTSAQTQPYDLLLRNARIVDGSGNPSYRGDVAIRGDTIARIAPRPILLIHGTADDYVPISNFRELNAAATSAPGAHVTTWIVPNARHAQAFKKTGAEYVTRVVAFFDAALGAAA